MVGQATLHDPFFIMVTQIYIPVNDHEEHWFCVNIDMAHRMAYIFDSSPSLTNDKRRELMARKLVSRLFYFIFLKKKTISTIYLTTFMHRFKQCICYCNNI